MNVNAIIAVLVIKAIITEDEGQALVEFLHDKPQSTQLSSSIADVAKIINKPAAPIMPQLGPVGPAQHAEEMALRTAPAVALPETKEPAKVTPTKKPVEDSKKK